MRDSTMSQPQGQCFGESADLPCETHSSATVTVALPFQHSSKFVCFVIKKMNLLQQSNKATKFLFPFFLRSFVV
jgi:hypothetical protein